MNAELELRSNMNVMAATNERKARLIIKKREIYLSEKEYFLF